MVTAKIPTTFVSGELARVEMPKLPARFTGTGDLFAALILAWGHEPLQVNVNMFCHARQSLHVALQSVCEKAICTMHAVLMRTLESALSECVVLYCYIDI